MSYPADVVRLTQDAEAVALVSDQGEVRARQAIIATGYERPRRYMPSAFSLTSTYAIATAPGTAPLWRENAMI